MKVIVCSEIVNTVDEVQIIPYGYHKTSKGDFLCDDQSAAEVIKDFRKRQNDMVIDYEHQTLTGAEAPAAGWIKKLTYRGTEGIWAKVEWTDKAKAYINSKEYRYLSPVFLKDTADNRVIKLINAALTNQPAIDGMVPLVNKEDGAVVKNKKSEVKPMKRVYEALGLSNGANEDDALKEVMALTSAITEATAYKDILKDIGLSPEATVSEVKATVMAMKQSHDSIETLIKEVMTLKEIMFKQDTETVVNSAISQGKIMPSQKPWALEYAAKDPEGFKLFVAKSPEVVPLKDITGKAAKTDDTVIEKTQHSVNKQLGISDELWIKRGQHSPEGDSVSKNKTEVK
ncbi:MAG: phage protease [Nitrospirae bacterium]|nr:phage protease [Nitrospirota bacterium]